MPSANTTLNLEYDYDTYTYLAVLLTPSSSLLADPSRIHPQLMHIGPAGALPDIHVFSIPKPAWEHSSATIMDALQQADDILRVDVQEPRKRAKKCVKPPPAWLDFSAPSCIGVQNALIDRL